MFYLLYNTNPVICLMQSFAMYTQTLSKRIVYKEFIGLWVAASGQIFNQSLSNIVTTP